MRDNRSGLIISLSGDRAAAAKLVGYGRVLLARMQAVLAGASGAKTWRPSPGVVIRTIQAGEVSILRIAVGADAQAFDTFDLLQGVLLHVSHDHIPLSFEGEDIPAVVYRPERDRYLFGNSQVSTAERKGSYRTVADQPYAGNRMWVGPDGHVLSWDGPDVPFPIERTFSQDHSEQFGVYLQYDDTPVPPSREPAAKSGLRGFYYRGLPVDMTGLLDQDDREVGQQINGAAFIRPPTFANPGLVVFVATHDGQSETNLYLAGFTLAQRREGRHILKRIRRLDSADWLQWHNDNLLATVFFRQDGLEAVGTIYGVDETLTKVRATVDIDASEPTGTLELDGAAGSFSQNTQGDHVVDLAMPYFAAGSDDERTFGITLTASDTSIYRGNDRYTYGTESWGTTRTVSETLQIRMGAAATTLTWSDITTLDIEWSTGHVPGTVYPGEARKEDALKDYDTTRAAVLITDVSLTSIRPEIECMVLEWVEDEHVSDHQYDFESEDVYGDGDVVFKRGDAALYDEFTQTYRVSVVAAGATVASHAYGPVTESGSSTYSSEDGSSQFNTLYGRYETESRPVDHGAYNPPSPYPPVPNFSSVSESLAREHHAAWMRFRYPDQIDALADFVDIAPEMRGQNIQVGCVGVHSTVVAIGDQHAYSIPVAMMASQAIRSEVFGLSPTDANPVMAGASWAGSLPLDMGVESSEFSPLYFYLL